MAWINCTQEVAQGDPKATANLTGGRGKRNATYTQETKTLAWVKGGTKIPKAKTPAAGMRIPEPGRRRRRTYIYI